MKSPFSSFALLCLLGLFALSAAAVVDIYEFDSESQRLRYHDLIEVLRCPKCQNQNLAGSDSQIAADLRRELHRLLLEGKSDKEIKVFMVDRYGDFVLYKPRIQKATLVLWLFPIVLLIGGLASVFYVVRSRSRKTVVADKDSARELSNNEKEKLSSLLDRSTSKKQGKDMNS